MTNLLLFSLKTWVTYTLIATGVIWGVFGFIDYFILGAAHHENTFDNPTTKRIDVDMREKVSTDTVEMDSIIKD